MIGMAGSALFAVAALVVTHDPHGCPEPPHAGPACLCSSYATVPYQPAPYSYRRPAWHPRPYPIAPQYAAPPPPPIYDRPPPYEVGGYPGYAHGPVGYVQGPPIYVDAPPVYVEPAQIYIERPQIIVRPSEVVVAPPEVHFEPCPEGAVCLQDPAPPPDSSS